MAMESRIECIAIVGLAVLLVCGSGGSAQELPFRTSGDTPADGLSSQEWDRIDASVDLGLAFLASQQEPDGSFPSDRRAQPAVTSLCVLAFMAHGQMPSEGP